MVLSPFWHCSVNRSTYIEHEKAFGHQRKKAFHTASVMDHVPLYIISYEYCNYFYVNLLQTIIPKRFSRYSLPNTNKDKVSSFGRLKI